MRFHSEAKGRLRLYSEVNGCVRFNFETKG